MNPERLTERSTEAFNEALAFARKSGNPLVYDSHLLRALLDQEESIVVPILKQVGVDVDALKATVEAELARYPKQSNASPNWSRELQGVYDEADTQAKALGDEYISTEHLLVALAGTKGAESVALLKTAGTTPQKLAEALKTVRGAHKVTDQTPENQYQALAKFTRDLTDLARKGKLDPVIGRDEEIRRVIQVLSRRTKNNPVLIGEPGVGKTAIAEGLAHRIVRGDVPENLKSKTIFSLDMGALIAGAKYKGEFEERLKSVVKEVIGSDGDVVLFIDEIHTLVGAGRSEGAMDAANILKPALARGELRAIGATTLAEYQKYIENDKALERRFQKVMVEEPDTQDAISILRGLKERYEMHHRVRIKDEAIISSVELSQRYISDRFLPDKAIDLLDEAASKLRLEMDSVPEELDELNRRIMQLEIEREAIKRENDEVKVNQLSEEIANLNEQRTGINARWQQEKEIVDGIQEKKEAIEQYKLEAEQAERNGDYGKVAEIRYGLVKQAEDDLRQLQVQLAEAQSDKPMVKQEVDSEDIAEVVSRWTGIPVQRMLQSERDKLLRLEDELHRRVVGQEEAIAAISDAVRRSRAGLQDPKKPIGSFIFLGTTGVGKTELAKALAEFLFNSDQAMIRIDMSEYQEKHTVSRLIGAPPGYVGYDEGGQLTEAVRRRPYSVVLLDEIEKAHPDVFNILLQVLDDGRLTDNKGRTANFRNTIIIMTSNLGSDVIREQFETLTDLNKEEVVARAKSQVFEILKRSIRPEFLNRIDEVIMFEPLSREHVREIVGLQMNHITRQLAEMGIELQADEAALDWLAQLGYDPQFGARPLKRVLQKRVVNELSKRILAGEVHKDSRILLACDGPELVFRNQPEA
jgi:ATP-dependent Clp protease ATP-binding subunit ClpB